MTSFARLRRGPVAAVVAVVAVPALLAGCSSGAGSKATRPRPSTTSVAAPSAAASASSSAKVPAALAAQLHQQLRSAGGDVDGAAGPITNADVDRAKAQEGSAP